MHSILEGGLSILIGLAVTAALILIFPDKR
jgi:hypothetical protein